MKTPGSTQLKSATRHFPTVAQSLLMGPAMKITHARSSCFAPLALSMAALIAPFAVHAGGLRGKEPCKTSLEGDYVFLESDRTLSDPREEDDCRTYRMRDVGYLSSTLRIARLADGAGKESLRVLQSINDSYPAFEFQNQAGEVENIGSAGGAPLNRIIVGSVGRCQASSHLQVWHLQKGLKSPEKTSMLQRSSEMSELTLVQQKDGSEILHLTTYERDSTRERSITCRYLKK